LDDELAKDLDFEDLSALRASVYDQIAEQKRQEEQSRLREGVLKQALALNVIETPQAMVDASMERLESQMRTRFQMQGMQGEWFDQIMQMQRPQMLESAQRLAQTDLILDAIATAQELEVEQSALDEKLSEMAQILQMPLPKLRAELARSGRVEAVRQDMRHDAAVDWLIDHAVENASNGVTPYEPPEDVAQLDNATDEVQDTDESPTDEGETAVSSDDESPAADSESDT
jgi:trigger factor